jgi:hypothetical protein
MKDIQVVNDKKEAKKSEGKMRLLNIMMQVTFFCRPVSVCVAL